MISDSMNRLFAKPQTCSLYKETVKLENQQDAGYKRRMIMRVGMGYDVHRLTEDRDLILVVKIDWEKVSWTFRCRCTDPCSYGCTSGSCCTGRYRKTFSGYRPCIKEFQYSAAGTCDEAFERAPL